MTEKLKKIMNDEVIKLPKEKQDAINGYDWVKATEEIGKKFSMTEVEFNDFQVETALVLLGLVDLDLYKRIIENDIGLGSEDAKNVTTEAYDKVFTPIIKSMESGVKHKEPKWDQRIHFILSGGDYSTFLEK